MKNFLAIFFCIPLFSWANCQEEDRKVFFASHMPNKKCTANSEGELCVESPRKIDDQLYNNLISFTTDFISEISENSMVDWPTNGREENIKTSRIPPETFLIVNNALRMDLTRRTVFVSCSGNEFYIRDNGGLMDKWNWYGPISINDIEKYSNKTTSN